MSIALFAQINTTENSLGENQKIFFKAMRKTVRSGPSGDIATSEKIFA